MIKQKLISLLIFTIILTTLHAQDNVNKFDKSVKRHGIWQKNYPNTDQLRYSGKFEHGKEIDTFKYYKLKRKKSVLSAIKIFNRENDIAEVTFMTSDGHVISKGKMNGKKFVGQWIYFHKGSNIVMIDEYYNETGLLHGNRKVFFKSGALAESIDYDNGKKNGDLKIYSESKKLLQHSKYKNNQLNGQTIYYNAEGNKIAVGEFKSNLKTGIWEYYNNGDLSKKVNHDTKKVIYKKQ